MSIHVIPGKPTGPVPRENVIDFLRQMLALAESGEMQSLAAAWIDAEGSASTGTTSKSLSMLGAITHLQQRVVRQ